MGRILFSLLSFEPHQGDFAIYWRYASDFSYQAMSRIDLIDQSQPGRVIYSIGNYNIQNNGQLNKQSISEINDLKMKKLYINDLKLMCANVHGTIERVRISAGRFEACKVHKNIGGYFDITDYYAAGVPLGIIKTVVIPMSDPSYIQTQELVQASNN